MAKCSLDNKLKVLFEVEYVSHFPGILVTEVEINYYQSCSIAQIFLCFLYSFKNIKQIGEFLFSLTLYGQNSFLSKAWLYSC